MPGARGGNGAGTRGNPAAQLLTDITLHIVATNLPARWLGLGPRSSRLEQVEKQSFFGRSCEVSDRQLQTGGPISERTGEAHAAPMHPCAPLSAGVGRRSSRRHVAVSFAPSNLGVATQGDADQVQTTWWSHGSECAAFVPRKVGPSHMTFLRRHP